MRRPSRTLLITLTLLVGGTALSSAIVPPSPPAASQRELDAAALMTTANLTAATWRQDPVDPADLPPLFREPSQGVYVAIRGEGKRREQSWQDGGTIYDSLRAGLVETQERRPSGRDDIDLLEIAIVHGQRQIENPAKQSRGERLADRGVLGLEIVHGERRKRFSPTFILAMNRNPSSLVSETAEEWGLEEADLEDATFRSFEATQLLVFLEPKPRAVQMFRGNIPVHADEVSAESTARLIELESEWLINGMHEDGRMTYQVWPERSREAKPSGNGYRNNMIRQWMATIALIRVAKDRDDPALFQLAERNIDYNLSQFYSEADGYGLIEFRQRVKLGALALATYALVNHPKREKWAQQEAAMRRTIDGLWHEDGRMDCFHKKPPGLKEFPNFYPGEALFLWADLYDKERDPQLLERFMKSFEYYKAWHLKPENRNPAFIPWHTQAYYQVWTVTQDQQLADFVFEMNDWLVDVQQWDGARYPDEPGRFYSTGRWFGPPHASATGVYMEGLIDAYRLAEAIGDERRAERYRMALARGTRSLMQLQFVDEVDTFYVAKPEMVRGGLRSAVYDSTIRCDNVQHGLMALLKIRESFAPADYVVEPPR